MGVNNLCVCVAHNVFTCNEIMSADSAVHSKVNNMAVNR